MKSYIHVRDVSRGELAAMERGRPGDIYHLSAERGIAVREIVRMICDRMGAAFEEVTTEVGERLGQDAAYVIDSGKARAELGWEPVTGLEEGLSGVIDWINREWSCVREEPLEYIHKE